VNELVDNLGWISEISCLVATGADRHALLRFPSFR